MLSEKLIFIVDLYLSFKQTCLFKIKDMISTIDIYFFNHL